MFDYSSLTSLPTNGSGANIDDLKPVLEVSKKPENENGSFFTPEKETIEMDAMGGFSPISAEDIFSFGEEKFNETVKKKGKEQQTDSEVGAQVSEMSPELIEISADMYVEILETLVDSAGRWWSKTTGSYLFEKNMKQKYKAITAMYFKTQNVQLTPSHFFALMTGVLLFSSGFRAYNDRNRKIKAESFQRKSKEAGQRLGSFQASFGPEFQAQPMQNIERSYFAAVREDGSAFYTKDATTGTYSKKEDRERVGPELENFIFDFKERSSSNRWPNRKEVKTFLNQ